jgi:hypothetical protein
MFIIITDGEENSSSEYSADKVKRRSSGKRKIMDGRLSSRCKHRCWETADIRISADRDQNYHADREGVELNFRVMMRRCFIRECSAMPDGWNDEIQKDYKNREDGNE